MTLKESQELDVSLCAESGCTAQDAERHSLPFLVSPATSEPCRSENRELAERAHEETCAPVPFAPALKRSQRIPPALKTDHTPLTQNCICQRQEEEAGNRFHRNL